MEPASMALNIAHRGARSLAPENTLLAARRGLEAGAHLWETDLGVTRDEELILLHDHSLARTTDVARRFPRRAADPCTAFSLAEIRRLDAGAWFLESDPFGQVAAGILSPAEQAACRGVRVPTLEEALVFTRDAGWGVNLELKTLPAPFADFPVVERMLAMVDRVGLTPGQIFFSSFHHPWLKAIQTRRPEFEVQALIGDDPHRPLEWGLLEFDVYNVRHTLIEPQEVRRLTDKGFTINLWTVNAVADLQSFLEAGAVGLITDFPQRLAAMGVSRGLSPGA
jgi:glycerophosphoryl diester phosphodiesterase